MFTFINGNITAVTITSASVSGTALPGTVPLSFDPTDLLVEETATADIALAGTISGSLEVSVSWVGDNETEGEATAGFDVTPCVPTTDRSRDHQHGRSRRRGRGHRHLHRVRRAEPSEQLDERRR